MAHAVAARTDFLGALSHLVRVYGDGGVDGRVRGARGVRYRPSPGDGKHGSTRGNRGRDARKREHAGCRGHAARATRESSRGRARGRDTRVRVASGRSRTCTDADVRLEEGRRASDERVLREWRPHFIKLVSDNSRETRDDCFCETRVDCFCEKKNAHRAPSRGFATRASLEEACASPLPAAPIDWTASSTRACASRYAA